MRLRSCIVVFAALPFLVSYVSAQDYRAWDRNNDGVVTRAEWRGTLQEFRDRDTNRDGVLSGTELRDLGWQSGPQDRDDRQTFSALDRNRDGRLSRGEWRVDSATFLRVDRNGDNHITRAEFLNANRRLAPSDAVRTSADEFSILDYNNNGVISLGEWRSGYGSFYQYDVNRDGVISRREFSTAGEEPVVRETIIVDARQPWTDTNIYVNAGDVVTYRADGVIQMSTDVNDRATPAGALSGRNATNSPRPDQKAGGLLLRIGTGPVMFLGQSGTVTAQTRGRLTLGVNDDHFPDNSGRYSVALSVAPR